MCYQLLNIRLVGYLVSPLHSRHPPSRTGPAQIHQAGAFQDAVICAIVTD